MNTGEKIKYLRKQKGLTLEELGKLCGVGKSTVRKWETGAISNMRRDKIAKLARALDVSPLYLLGVEDPAQRANTGVRIPVVGSVRAGIPNDAIEDIIDYEEIAPEMAMRGKMFGLKIRGDSMEPRIKDGDVVIVLETPDVENGDLAVVLVNGNDATIKQISKTADALTLIPFNTSYTPMVYTAEQCKTLPVQIIGKVIELRAKF